MRFRLFDAAMLPPGFVYPDALVRLAAGAPQRILLPWSFVDADSEVGRLARLAGRQDGCELVPFASVADARKDVACFDGNDHTGDPPVHLLVASRALPRRADFADAADFANFAHWQQAADEDALRWRRTMSALVR